MVLVGCPSSIGDGLCDANRDPVDGNRDMNNNNNDPNDHDDPYTGIDAGDGSLSATKTKPRGW